MLGLRGLRLSFFFFVIAIVVAGRGYPYRRFRYRDYGPPGPRMPGILSLSTGPQASPVSYRLIAIEGRKRVRLIAIDRTASGPIFRY